MVRSHVTIAARLLQRTAVALALFGSGSAAADQLDAQVDDDERGYYPIQELSYEVIVDAGVDHGEAATVRVRVALHNGSAIARDAVHMLALPRGAELVGLSIAKDGVWHPGRTTAAHDDPDGRAPGTVWARTTEPARAGGVPGAEIVAFGIEPESTLQVEVELKLFPVLRAGRWEFELPSRGREQPQLASERRVLVRGLPTGRSFTVDDTVGADGRAILTDGSNPATVAWQARAAERGALIGRYDVTPGPPGFDDGRFRVVLRAGSMPAATPDHVVFVVDRSRSTAAKMHSDAGRVIERMLDALPQGASFDAIGFARTAVPLLSAPATAFDHADRSARDELARVLDANLREQGTDLGAALELAARRIRDGHHQRPLVLVVTDGMLPASVDANALRGRFDAAAGKHRPELMFLVDDPLLARSGLPSTHPVATMAAGLGARISLESLAQVSDDAVLQLLAAPRVLGDLALELPSRMKLDEALPIGLVAGNALVARGRYTGTPAKSVTVRGRAGRKPIRQRLRAQIGPPQAEAFVAVLAGDVALAVSEGFTRPAWLRPGQQRTAREGVERSGLGHEQAGYLTGKIIRNYVTTRVVPRARACYNRSLLRNRDQAGRVVLEMEVGKGEVMTAKVRTDALTHDDEVLLGCLTEAAWALDVPAAKMDDQIYVVRYPLRLVAPVREGETGKVDRVDDAMLEVLLAQPAGRVKTH